MQFFLKHLQQQNCTAVKNSTDSVKGVRTFFHLWWYFNFDTIMKYKSNTIMKYKSNTIIKCIFSSEQLSDPRFL